MLVDSHCHLDILDLSAYGGDLQKAIVAARQKDVGRILCPGLSFDNFANVLNIANTYDNVWATVGVHPTEKIKQSIKLEDLIVAGEHKKIIGIGETGLDFYYCRDKIQKERQKDLFKLHILAAKTLNKPLIIHAREMFKILLAEKENITGVMHCYTGNIAFAEKLLELGFYISFAGIVTFNKANNLAEVAKTIPLDKILIETDAPYLSPVPVRGQSNEPANLHYIAEFIAKIRHISYETFASHTTENFLQLF
jgi:TatD DNase family protein